jgi:NitT/TauT family transport system substrate-binding protein
MATQDRKKVEEVLPGYAKIDPQVASVITLPGFPSSLSKTRMQRISDLMSTSGLLKEKPDLDTVLFQPTS